MPGRRISGSRRYKRIFETEVFDDQSVQPSIPIIKVARENNWIGSPAFL
jgi:hypothetical protein